MSQNADPRVEPVAKALWKLAAPHHIESEGYTWETLPGSFRSPYLEQARAALAAADKAESKDEPLSAYLRRTDSVTVVLSRKAVAFLGGTAQHMNQIKILPSDEKMALETSAWLEEIEHACRTVLASAKATTPLADPQVVQRGLRVARDLERDGRSEAEAAVRELTDDAVWLRGEIKVLQAAVRELTEAAQAALDEAKRDGYLEGTEPMSSALEALREVLARHEVKQVM